MRQRITIKNVTGVLFAASVILLVFVAAEVFSETSKQIGIVESSRLHVRP
ncbi:hypothetical protein ACFL0O_03505 [Thermodesulfobacteriota bacterium]